MLRQMYDESSVDPSEIGGQINVPGQPSRAADGRVEYNTLDEPIRDTIVSPPRSRDGMREWCFFFRRGVVIP